MNDSSRAKGGATGLAILSALELSARGLKVSFVCGDAGDAPELKAKGIDVIAAGSGRLLDRGRAHAMRKGVYDRQMRDFIDDVVRKTEGAGTVYHLHGWAQIFSPAVFAALARVAPRTFVHAHDMFLACPNGVYMDYRRNVLCTRTPLSANCVLTHCDKRSYAHKLWRVMRQRALFRNFDPAQGWAGILTIHPGMLPRLARAGYPDALMKVLRNPATPYTDARVQVERNSRYVYVGRLEEDKGVLDLARAVSRVGAELVCVGDGVLKDRLAQEFPGIQVTGWLSKSEIGQWVGNARALVMPSHHPEPFALVLAEAIGSGLPVAVAKTALMAEEIEAAGLGLSFDVFDPDDMDRVIREFREMEETTIEQMSWRCREGPVKLALDAGEWVERLVGLYEGAVSAA
ncbi:glycosyltransferase family 4 protein [Marimonas lutisalis]|uniref:glycosyltransferase family 4 protein n=1 Tax=Marimonas lutisalis TaxID=2545756 RepID=UPI001375E30F|nr:glycosyltransferase family 4 protein [Marimonas lutisalis]